MRMRQAVQPDQVTGEVEADHLRAAVFRGHVGLDCADADCVERGHGVAQQVQALALAQAHRAVEAPGAARQAPCASQAKAGQLAICAARHAVARQVAFV
ncbi:hypothetical protein D3C72_1571770 [compost metagenome]